MKAVVFSGTTEGRELCLFLSGIGIEVLAFVATRYGAEVMPETENIIVNIGRLSAEEMAEKIADRDLIIDATHPYATEVSRNIKTACKQKNKNYIRLLRDEIKVKNAVVADNIKNAVEYLLGTDTDGDIFVSTGSKELDLFLPLKHRVIARVLPASNYPDKGFKRIIYQNPPFSIEDNLEHFKNCKYLVTKNSGTSGGFVEKIKAAEQLEMIVILIKRPVENGYSMEEVKRIIKGNTE